MSSNIDCHQQLPNLPRKPKREKGRKKGSEIRFEQQSLMYYLKGKGSVGNNETAGFEQGMVVKKQDELKGKEDDIMRLQNEYREQKEKLGLTKKQLMRYSTSVKQLILKSKKDLSSLLRKERGIINPKYGYFKDQYCKCFSEGQYLLEIRQKISQKEEKISELQKIKIEMSRQQKQIFNSRIRYNRKQLKQLKSQLQIRQKQIGVYKQNLILFHKQSQSIFSKQSWPIIKSRYQPLSLIGSGGFGQVYKGFDIQTYQDIAIKIHNIDSNKLTPQNYSNYVRYLEKQIKIHQTLKHPNIVKLIDQLSLENNRIGFVMEYCSGPQLRSYLRKQGCLDQRQAKHIVKQLIYAIKYLHSQKQKKQKIIHYDLKPANILFHYGIIKIVDFGISKSIQTQDSRIDLTTPGIGTYWYLPPEVFQNDNAKISPKVDVWSVGVIFYEMLYGKRPFGNGLSQSKILATGAIKNAQSVRFPSSSPKDYKISEQAKEFIRSCLEYDWQKRLSSLQAYEHDYLQ